MEPPPKRMRPDDSIAAPDAPPAAVLPSPAADLSVVAPPPAAEPLAEAPAVAPTDVLSQHWHVFGNDPNDASGIRSVLLAEHSRGKPEAMVRAAFPHLSDEDGEVASFVEMDASNVFRHKKGGGKDDAIADAKTTCKKLIELADKHGTNLRELGLMCNVGLSPMDSIVATTKTAAECLGWQDQVGTLEVGKLADVIVSQTDPLADIRSLEDVDNIRLVMKDGRIVKNLM